MTGQRLGYMSRESWDRLTDEDKLYYLYDAAINRCKDCREDFAEQFEPKRSPLWKAGFFGLVSVCSMIGGAVVQLLGLGPSQIGPK